MENSLRNKWFMLAVLFTALLAGCSASKETANAWVFHSYPKAEVISTFGYDDEAPYYVLCNEGTVVILHVSRSMPTVIITDTVPLPSSVSCNTGKTVRP